MAVDTAFDADRNLVLITLAGDTTVEELVAAYDNLFQQIEFEPNMAAVWDLSRFDLKRKPINDVRDLARQLRQYGDQRGDQYKAGVVTTRPVDFQLLRIYLGILRIIGSQVTIKVFSSLDDAYEWIE